MSDTSSDVVLVQRGLRMLLNKGEKDILENGKGYTRKSKIVEKRMKRSSKRETYFELSSCDGMNCLLLSFLLVSGGRLISNTQVLKDINK